MSQESHPWLQLEPEKGTFFLSYRHSPFQVFTCFKYHSTLFKLITDAGTQSQRWYGLRRAEIHFLQLWDLGNSGLRQMPYLVRE